MNYLAYNGQIIPEDELKISSADRGFLLADGLFETIRIIDQHPEYLQEHLARLFHGAEILNIAHDMTFDDIASLIAALMDANDYADPVLSARLTLTRGSGPRGLLPSTVIAPTVLLTLSPYTVVSEKDYTLCVVEQRRNEFSKLSQLKTLSYKENVHAKMQALKKGADDALLLNTKGNVVCTSCANIFIIQNNRLITPPITDGILPGIMRAQVIKASALPVVERSITLEECQAADEMFITNSLLGKRRVQAIVTQ